MDIKIDQRAQQLHTWCQQQLAAHASDFSFSTLSADASFRRYFRLEFPAPISQSFGGNPPTFIKAEAPVKTLVAVDAPPEKEDNQAFISIAGLLSGNGVVVPFVYAKDTSFGFMILQDFGDQLLLPLLSDASVDAWYQQALILLQQMQTVRLPDTFPKYSEHKLLEELQVFNEWFVSNYLGCKVSDQEQSVIDDAFKELVSSALQQPQCFVHRDFHSRNLMVIEQESTGPMLGAIDFQDAVRGPLTYDLVSILKDCYVQWPRDQVLKWVERFRVQSPQAKSIEQQDFVQQFELMGLQRHIKVLGVFARLGLRDDKTQYWQDLPLVMYYVLEALACYPQFAEFNRWMLSIVLPLFMNKERMALNESLIHNTSIKSGPDQKGDARDKGYKSDGGYDNDHLKPLERFL